MEKPLRKRSRDGCFTCRRRKKKCDESLFPRCRNCHSNDLQCTWPQHVIEAKKLRRDGELTKKRKVSQTSADFAHIQPLVDPLVSPLEHMVMPGPVAVPNPALSPQDYLRRRLSEPLSASMSSASEEFTNLIGGSATALADISQPIAHTKAPQESSYDTDSKKAETRRKNVILERIAMQQDCVGEEDEVNGYGLEDVDRDLIRSYIAHQMDVGETLRRKR